MARRYVVPVVAVCVMAAQAFAGVSYTAVTKAEGGRDADKQDMTVKAMVEGDKARMEFVESRNPMMKSGGYMLTRDAGKDLYMVDVQDKSYMKFDIEKMMNGMMEMAKGMMSMTFSDPKVEKVLDEAGPKILGYDTKHYKLRTTYKVDVAVMGMKSSSSILKEDEIWATKQFKDPGLAAFAKAFQFRAGDKQIDDLVKQTMSKVEGFSLKTISVTTTTDANGKSEVTKTTTEVTELKSETISADKFEIPADYKETTLQLPESKPGKKGKKGGEAKGEMPPEALEFLKSMGGDK